MSIKLMIGLFIFFTIVLIFWRVMMDFLDYIRVYRYEIEQEESQKGETKTHE